MYNLTYQEAVAKAKHLIALDQTTVYLRDATGFPFDKVNHVEEGGTWRLNMPTSCYLFVEEAGLTLKLSVDFEPFSENGTGTINLDRMGLRDLMLKLSPVGQAMLAALLQDKALPALKKRADELRTALARQADSEDCVRGVIAMAREPA